MKTLKNNKILLTIFSLFLILLSCLGVFTAPRTQARADSAGPEADIDKVTFIGFAKQVMVDEDSTVYPVGLKAVYAYVFIPDDGVWGRDVYNYGCVIVPTADLQAHNITSDYIEKLDQAGVSYANVVYDDATEKGVHFSGGQLLRYGAHLETAGSEAKSFTWIFYLEGKVSGRIAYDAPHSTSYNTQATDNTVVDLSGYVTVEEYEAMVERLTKENSGSSQTPTGPSDVVEDKDNSQQSVAEANEFNYMIPIYIGLGVLALLVVVYVIKKK